MRISGLSHLGKEMVQDPVGFIAGNQSVSGGRAVHEGKAVTVESPVLALPPGEHTRGGIIERDEVNRRELFRARSVQPGIFRLFRMVCQVRHAQRCTVRQRIGIGIMVPEANHVPPIGGRLHADGRP